jgi:hypothetical protein
MTRTMRMLLAVALVLCWAAAAVAQTAGGDYLDVYIVQVKPDKRAEFDALSKRMAEANRRNGGDQWLAMETMYGEANSVTFVSTRSNYADVETGMNKFMGAAQKGFGAGMDKMFADFNSCLVSARGELRMRRWDLSWNAPSSPAEYAKLLGQSKYLRTNMIHVRPGHAADFEAMLKELKAAREKNSPNEVGLVSQVVAGQQGITFYVTTLKPNFAAFDSVPTMQKVMGDEAFNNYMKRSADVVESAYAMINRFLPDQSAAPEEVVAAGGDFWAPKPVMAENAKKKGKNTQKGEPGQ